MKARIADGYIRVSRRGGREGESFISPDVQREKIATWAKAHGIEIIHWWEEIDQSGAKLDRPMFQEALARCERGETAGIVVARLDRFAQADFVGQDAPALTEAPERENHCVDLVRIRIDPRLTLGRGVALAVVRATNPDEILREHSKVEGVKCH